MFNLFRRSPVLKDFSFLGCDMHSHLLPGIDDGAQDIEQSLKLISGLAALGFTQLFTTPHVMMDLYPNTPERILAKKDLLKKNLAEKGIAIGLDAAAEYLLDEGFSEKLQQGKILTLPGNRVLVETSLISAPPQLDQLLFQLQAKGYRPVLAHPERYLFYRQDFKKYQEFKERGVELQLNLLSLTGYYGKHVSALAHKLLKHDLIDFLGTDLHHEKHLNRLQAMLKNRKIGRLLLKREWRNKELL